MGGWPEPTWCTSKVATLKKQTVVLLITVTRLVWRTHVRRGRVLVVVFFILVLVVIVIIVRAVIIR